MGYFPFFINIEGKSGLIVGGGMVACRKLEKLLPYGPRLTVTAPEFCPDIKKMAAESEARMKMAVVMPEDRKLVFLQESFRDEMIEDMFFVIAATDDQELNHHISLLCQERNIPVNVVDDPEACTFLFPALIKEGNLSVGISTGGASPSAAKYIKRTVAEAIPDHMGEILDYLGALREEVKAALPEEKQRARCFEMLFCMCMERQRPLSREELDIALYPNTGKNQSGGWIY